MTRSEINRLIERSEAFFAEMKFLLPPWGSWRPADWQGLDPAIPCEIFEKMLGWDITDFGSGCFAQAGLILFTIRNGSLKGPGKKPYAEKIMIVEEGQVTPYHFHWRKTEDIINRGGGNLVIKIYGSTPQEDFSDQPVRLMVDGLGRTVAPGGIVTLTPGESICLETGVYHSFWGEPGRGRTLVGEVSVVNNDLNDNRFHQPLARFPEIVEDQPPHRLLTTDYPKFCVNRAG